MVKCLCGHVFISFQENEFLRKQMLALRVSVCLSLLKKKAQLFSETVVPIRIPPAEHEWAHQLFCILQSVAVRTEHANLEGERGIHSAHSSGSSISPWGRVLSAGSRAPEHTVWESLVTELGRMKLLGSFCCLGNSGSS